jgi:hypothetical protein
LIFLACLLPLAVYLLLLGNLNRRRRPVIVPGAWDAIGLLFAVSGFLLLGGPAILTSLNERWRMFWLLGQGGGSAAAQVGASWPIWTFLSLFYFFTVTTGVAYLIWRARRQTCIYNVDPPAVERALIEAFHGQGVDTSRIGNSFRCTPAGDSSSLNTPVELEVDAFQLMRHVTLRWSPVDSPLRTKMEVELSQRLDESPDHETGPWLTMMGLMLLGSVFLGTVYLVLRWHLRS